MLPGEFIEDDLKSKKPHCRKAVRFLFEKTSVGTFRMIEMTS